VVPVYTDMDLETLVSAYKLRTRSRSVFESVEGGRICIATRSSGAA